MSSDLSSLKVIVSENEIVPTYDVLLIYENSQAGFTMNDQVSFVVEFPPDHFQLSSTVHFELQPSPLIRFPSSHSRNSRLNPLPHFSRHVFVSGSNLRPVLIWSQVLQELSEAINLE